MHTGNSKLHGVERIVVVPNFRPKLRVRGVRPMARIGQEGLNNFLTDHLSRYLLGCGIRSLGRR